MHDNTKQVLFLQCFGWLMLQIGAGRLGKHMSAYADAIAVFRRFAFMAYISI